MKTYKIDFGCGTNLDQAHQQLQETYNRLKPQMPDLEYVEGEFNCYTFTSKMSLDDIYMVVFDKTKAEVEEEWRKEREERIRERKEYEAKIPELVKEYEKKFREDKAIKPESMDELVQHIEAVLKSIYRNYLLDAFLDIVHILYDNRDDKDKALEEAKKKFDEQGHSGNTAGIVGRMVQTYSIYHGDDFFYMEFPHAKKIDEAEAKGERIVN